MGNDNPEPSSAESPAKRDRSSYMIQTKSESDLQSVRFMSGEDSRMSG